MKLQDSWLKNKTVFITVYVEKPTKRRSTITNKNGHHHHYAYHHHIDRSKNGEGYNKRADLLRYSQHLREVAKSSVISSSPQQPKSVIVPETKEQRHSPKVVPCIKTQKVNKRRVCFEWMSLLKFDDNKMKTTKKKTENAFISKVIAKMQNCR